MLKSEVQALPTYNMGVFKLPKVLLKERNKIMCHYWWEQQQDENRIHWVSWSQLGKVKIVGGLGFQDLEIFNLVMLSKQGWRLIQRLDSLASKVLKLKYFPTTTLFQEKVGSRPSYIWRSIMATRQLVEERSMWMIGNGENVKIWKDKWIPQPRTY